MEIINLQEAYFRRYLLITKVVLVALFIVMHHLIITIPFLSQWIFFGVFVVLTGIPHGALDHEVAKQSSRLNQLNFSAVHFYIRYLTPMLVYGVCWFLLPTISLYIFLLLSAFHFGETDLPIPADQSSFTIIVLQTSYGLLVLFLILFLNLDEVLPIVDQINIFSPSLIRFLKSPTAASYSLIGASLFFLIALVAYFIAQKQITKMIKRIAILLAIVTISAVTLSLPISFAIYFGLWHSIISLENIRLHLSVSAKKEMTWLKLIAKCIPFTLFSFIGIFALIFFFDLNKNIDLFLMGLFIGISILTLPHQEVMSKMYFQIRKKPTNE
jgi:Brp/Blh family beta-carotene 15,15'-monooxygenase